jgi:hypothetical protein
VTPTLYWWKREHWPSANTFQWAVSTKICNRFLRINRIHTYMVFSCDVTFNFRGCLLLLRTWSHFWSVQGSVFAQSSGFVFHTDLWDWSRFVILPFHLHTYKILKFIKHFKIFKITEILRYSMYNDHISYLVNGWRDFYKHDIILKDLSNKNNPP